MSSMILASHEERFSSLSSFLCVSLVSCAIPILPSIVCLLSSFVLFLFSCVGQHVPLYNHSSCSSFVHSLAGQVDSLSLHLPLAHFMLEHGFLNVMSFQFVFVCLTMWCFCFSCAASVFSSSLASPLCVSSSHSLFLSLSLSCL